MTKGITDMLNLPSLDEVLKDQGVNVNASVPEVDDPQITSTIAKLHDLTARMVMAEGTDHTDTMDALYKEILAHAREMMSYGFNIDQHQHREPDCIADKGREAGQEQPAERQARRDEVTVTTPDILHNAIHFL